MRCTSSARRLRTSATSHCPPRRDVRERCQVPHIDPEAGEGEFARLGTIVGADELMPRWTGEIWRAIPERAARSGELAGGLELDDVERWLTYVPLMLVGTRAQTLSDPTATAGCSPERCCRCWWPDPTRPWVPAWPLRPARPGSDILRV